MIKDKVKVDKKFSFREATTDEIYSHIKRLDPKTATVKDDISIKHMLGCNDIISPFLTNIVSKYACSPCSRVLMRSVVRNRRHLCVSTMP